MHRTPPPAQAFLFDLDGVLVDTQSCHLEAYRQLAGSLNMPLSRPVRELILAGSAREQVLHALLGTRDHPRWQALFDQKARTYTALLSSGAVQAMEGARESLEALAALGVVCGVVSNSRLAGEVLSATGLAEFLSVVIDGSQVKAPKPDPGGYLAAAAALDVRVAGCVALEDSGPGVRAARAAGMHVVAVGPGAPAEEADAHWPALSAERVRCLAVSDR